MNYAPVEVSRIRTAWESVASGRARGVAPRCFVVETTTSTQDDVKAHLDAEAETTGGKQAGTPVLVVAAAQTQARGTRGRVWDHDAQGDIGMSFSIEPDFDPRLLPMLIPVAIRLALVESMREQGADFEPDRLRAKWPNDLLVDGAKLAGILIESHGTGRWIVGIGINVGRRTFPYELDAIATSLMKATGIDFDRCSLLCNVIVWIGRLIQRAATSPDAILTLYESALDLVGREVDVRVRDRSHAGRLARIDLTHATFEDGRRFACGEIESLSCAKE
ncbi:MAG: biotin--[acetyl-CoA-carboxylase] ligase [Planctomycetes bacterium]|nr:biotin--[acetyl-CoA-carboxylase] ligase [Planctomycetota bacterium]MCB9891874.1 biotin--[acetyl-CoA-carboxylase] ligase [Planctomycetota bacterium]MCB9919865.1 biotin--[acetyl-CoA-carboxylase] ligase [Planctomycetota bacterium]